MNARSLQRSFFSTFNKKSKDFNNRFNHKPYLIGLKKVIVTDTANFTAIWKSLVKLLCWNILLKVYNERKNERAFSGSERERERAFIGHERERERERASMNANVNANGTF